MEWCYDYDGVYPITRLELSAISAIKSGQCWDVFDLFWHLVFVLNSFLAVVPATSYRSLSSFSFLSFSCSTFRTVSVPGGWWATKSRKGETSLRVFVVTSAQPHSRTRSAIQWDSKRITGDCNFQILHCDIIAQIFIPTLLHRASMIDQFDKFQFSRLSPSILQKDFLLETNWVRDLQSSNFCSKTPWRLVGARATREGGVLQLKLISQIVSDFWFIPLFDCTICHVWCICSNLM